MERPQRHPSRLGERGFGIVGRVSQQCPCSLTTYDTEPAQCFRAVLGPEVGEALLQVASPRERTRSAQLGCAQPQVLGAAQCDLPPFIAGVRSLLELPQQLIRRAAAERTVEFVDRCLAQLA